MTDFIDVSWEQIKDFSDSRGHGLQFVEFDSHYDIRCADAYFKIKCRINKNPTDTTEIDDFENNYKADSNKLIVEDIKTRFERDDIRLQIAKAETTPDVNGDSEISIKIPGNPGDIIYIGGGYAFTDVFTFGDYVKAINIVDVDNILGYGAEFVVATYHDDRVGSSNQGWYMWPSPQAGGEIEIEPLGFYGEVPSGLYIELYFKTTAATKIFCDFFWGKQI